MNETGQALLITLGLLVVSLIFVGLAMWGLYKFFSDHSDSDEKEDNKL